MGVNQYKSWKMAVKRTWRIFLNTVIGTLFIYSILASFQYAFSLYSENLPLVYHNLDEAHHDLFLFLITLISFLIPIIGYSIWIILMKFKHYCKSRESEFQLLKYQGFSTRELKKLIFLDTFLIILLSAGLTLGFGNLIISILFKNVFSVIFAQLEALSWLAYFVHLFSYQNFILSLGIASLLIFFGLLSGMNWINRKFVLSYSSKSEKRSSKKKNINWISVIFGILFLVPALLPLFINRIPSGKMVYDIVLLLGYVGPILVVIFGSMIWRAVFPYLISIISKRMEKSKKNYQSWKVFQFNKDWKYNRIEYMRRIFLFSLMFGLIVTGIGFQSNYHQNTVLKYLFINGGGVYQRISFSPYSQNVSSVQNIITNLKNHKMTIGFQDVGTHIDLLPFEADISPEFNKTIAPVVVDFSFYQDLNILPDDWLVNSSWESLYDDLLQPNKMLCPYRPNQYFSVGDSIIFQYNNTYNVTFQQEISIVGFYKFFPLEIAGSYSSYPGELLSRSYLISSASNLSWYPIEHIELTYHDLTVPRLELFKNIESFLESMFPELGFSTSFVSETDYRPDTLTFLKYWSRTYEYATSEFIRIIIICFLLFITISQLVEIDSQHKINKITTSNLRNLGISRKNLFFYELIKFNIILGGSALFSFIGVLSLKMIYIIQNVINGRYQALFSQKLHHIYVAVGFVILYIVIINLIKLWELWYTTKYTIVSHSKKRME